MDIAETYRTAYVHDSRKGEARWVANSILQKKGRYTSVEDATRVPYWVVGIIHGLECSMRFDCHLHNGDPLTDRTVRVPHGRPLFGNPPFRWEQSAIDALVDRDRPAVWTVGATLEFLEAYNGLGYRKRGIPSPYIWAGTNIYTSGKYVRDGKFDPAAVSKQLGAAATMKAFEEYGFRLFPEQSHA